MKIRIFQILKNYKIVVLLIISYLTLIIYFLSDYLIFDFTIWSALFLSPYIIYPNGKKTKKNRYFWISLVFIGFAFFTKVLTFYFLGSAFAILFTIEYFTGNIGTLPLFLTGLLSPTFKYFNNLFGFPVRLQLSEWAGNILSMLGFKAVVSGNVILLNGTEFSVDPACVGLKMMAVSVLCGILIISFFQRQKKIRFSFLSISLIISLIVFLNIFSNLLRILLLTIFRILPDNPNHDLVGIACLIFYIIIPTYFIVKFLSNRILSKYDIENTKRTYGLKNGVLLASILLFAMAITGFTRINNVNKESSFVPGINIKGYSQSVVKGDIVKLEKPGILAYIKPIQRFFGAEHNPMICWIGSGYEFGCIKTEIVNNKEIYTGILKKGNEKLYSAWWFDDGKLKTIKQIDWRWSALKGDKFYLINISSENKNLLMTEVKLFLDKNVFLCNPNNKGLSVNNNPF